MKKVGRQVHFIPTGKNNPRNGEGSFIRLKNNSILFFDKNILRFDIFNNLKLFIIFACFNI